MLTLWGRKTSVNVQKPMWLIGELGLPVDRKDVGGAFGGLDTAEYGQMNPHRVVPTLCDDEVIVWESEAVLRYLGSRYGSAYFGEDPAARSQIDQWMSWVQSSWSPAMTAVFVTHIRVARQDRQPDQVAAQISRLHQLATLADRFLGERDFIASGALSLADFSFGAFLYRYHTLEIERPALKNLSNYYARLSDRPAYAEHVQVDYDGMRIPGAERPGG
ncbi:MAG: glutathione S-transferase family protein [Burkholderiaceae bacterium]